MVEGKTLLVLLLCACCQDPARVPSQPSRVRSVHARKLCLYSPSVLQDGPQSNFMARPCRGRGRKQRNETNIASQRGTLTPPPFASHRILSAFLAMCWAGTFGRRS